MILFKDVCSILGQFRKYFLHLPPKSFTSSTILHVYIHIHFSVGFRKRFFQKLTLECVLCYRFYSTSYVLGLCHLNQKWPKGHRTEPQRFRAAVKMRNTKRLKFEINLKLRKCGDHWCAVCEARAARSDIYRSRFHPISAVLLTPTPTLAPAPARTGGSVSFSIVAQMIAQMILFRRKFGLLGPLLYIVGGDLILMGRNDL